MLNSNYINYWLRPELVLVFFIFFTFFGFNPFSIGLNEIDFNSESSSVIRRIVYLVFFGSSLLLFFQSKVTFVYLMKTYYPFILFGLFILLSVLWSVAPSVSLIRAILYLISLFTLMFLLTLIDVEVFLNTLTKMFSALLLLSFISIFLISTAVHTFGELAGNWRGIYLHKSDAGLAMVFSILLFIRAYLVTKKNYWFFLIFLAVIFLVKTGSKTSLGLLLIAIVSGFYFSSVIYNRYYLRFHKVFFTFVLIGFAVFLFLWQGKVSILIDEILYDPEGFTGRSLIWDYLLNMISDKPYLGYGFRSVWGMGDDSYLYDYSIGHSFWLFQLTHGHNSYLDLLLMLGVVGMFFFILIYVMPHIIFLERNACLKANFVFIFYGFFIFFLLHGLLESNFLLADLGRWVIFQALILLKTRMLSTSNN